MLLNSEVKPVHNFYTARRHSGHKQEYLWAYHFFIH